MSAVAETGHDNIVGATSTQTRTQRLENIRLSMAPSTLAASGGTYRPVIGVARIGSQGAALSWFSYPPKLRGRGQDDVGCAFPCGSSTIPVTIRVARVR